MRCDCSIPKRPGGLEECQNKAQYKVTLTADFGRETCYWCQECVNLGADMIQKAVRINI